MIKLDNFEYPTLSELERKRAPDNFDLLRVLLALMVMLAHSYCILGALPLPFEIQYLSLSPVPFFFFVSGYLVTGSLLRTKSLLQFGFNRLLRIYPVLLVASFIALMVVGLLGCVDSQAFFTHTRTWTYPLRQMTFHHVILEGGFPSSSTPGIALGTQGSVRTLLECYVALATLGLIGVMRRRGLVLVLLILAFLDLNYFHWIMHLYQRPTFFLAGACMYLFRDRIRITPQLFLIAALVFLIGMPDHFNLVGPLFGGYAILYFAYCPQLRLSKFGRFGDPSYGIFVYGYLVQQVVSFQLHRYNLQITPIGLTAISWVITIPIAYVSWFLVEKRALALKKIKFWTRFLPLNKSGLLSSENA